MPITASFGTTTFNVALLGSSGSYTSTATEILYHTTTSISGTLYSGPVISTFGGGFNTVTHPHHHTSSSITSSIPLKNTGSSASLSSHTSPSTIVSIKTVVPLHSPSATAHTKATGLSTGAQAGIGIGVGVVGLAIIALLAFYLFRRRTRKMRDTPKISYRGSPDYEKPRNDQEGRANVEALPSWKSELGGDAARFELNGQQQARHAELDSNARSGRRQPYTLRSPIELDGEPVGDVAHDEVSPGRNPQKGQPGVPAGAPPIPYASKPFPP